MSEIPVIQAERAGQAFLLALDQLRVGAPKPHQGLAVAPVYRPVETAPAPYRLLADAVASGEAEIEETESVPVLRVHNRGPVPVLILAGEELAGGWQNRIANTTVLVPAACVLSLPVTCVEQGSWGHHRGAFREGELSYPGLRRQAQAQTAAARAQSAAPSTDQGAIWQEVGRLHQRTHTASPTGAMRDAYASRANDLAAAVAALPFPDGQPIGVVVLIGGTSYCADLFDTPATLRAFWPRLIRSAMLDALGRPAAQPSANSAARLLAYAGAAARAVYAPPGLGLDVRVTSHEVEGAALVWEGLPVHISLFRRR